jgi:CBS domain-containing protein
VKVIDIMTSPVLTVTASTPVVEALRLLAGRRVSGLPVVDDEGRVRGIVTEQDLLRRAVEPAGHATELAQAVGEVMTAAPHTVSPDTDVADVSHLFSMMSWKALPVVRHGRLIGMVSRSDVVRALSRPDAEVRRDVETVLAAAAERVWRVDVDAGVVTLTGVPVTPSALELARSVVGVRAVRHRRPSATVAG